MRGFWIVVARELMARRLVLAVSAAMGLFVALLPWLALAPASRPDELRGAGAVGALALWGLALAAGLGATAVGAPLASRRLAFDFRLPLSAAAIWLGRLAAGALLVLAGAGLVVLVPLPFGLDLAGAADALDLLVERVFPGPQEIEGLLALAPLLLVAVFLLAHAAAVGLAGARSWLALDLGAVLTAKLAVWIAWRELGPWYAFDARWRLLAGAVVASIAGIVAASAAAARFGRSEPDRAHRSLALGLAAAGLIVAGSAQGYARWFVRPQIDDLVARTRRAVRLTSEWEAITGAAAGRGDIRFAFLRSAPLVHRLGPTPEVLGAPHLKVAAESGLVVWFERVDAGAEHGRLWTLDGRDAHALPLPSEVRWSEPRLAWAVSPDGLEVASAGWAGPGGSRIERQEIARGGTLGVVVVPTCRFLDGPIQYRSPTRLRVSCTPRSLTVVPASPSVFEIDLTTGEITELGPATPGRHDRGGPP